MLTTIVSFIVVLGILVFFHELGHFMVAKFVGVQVEEFAIGMGPKIIGKQAGETLYSIRALPLGGFCKLTGEMPIDEDSDEEEIELYQQAVNNNKCLFQKSVWERIAVISMGPIMNFLLAIILFSLIFSVFGVPVSSSPTPVIGQVIPDQPAYQAGLQEGDKILAINGKNIKTWNQLSQEIHKNPEQEIVLKVKRDNKIFNAKVVPRSAPNKEIGLIGITPVLNREPVNIFKSMWLGFKQTILYIIAVITGLWKMITGQIPGDVSGPVKIAQFVGDATRSGMLRVMNLSAIISINLGIMNLLPIPALDGGHLIFLGIEIVRGKPIDPEKEGMAHLVGFILLMILFVVIMIKDLKNIF